MTTEFSVYIVTGGASCLCRTSSNATRMSAFLGLLAARALFPVTIGVVLPIAVAVRRCCSCESIESSFYLCFGEILTASAMVMSCYAGRKFCLRMLLSNRFNQNSVDMSTKISVLLTARRACRFFGTRCRATIMRAFLGLLTASTFFPMLICIVLPFTVAVRRCYSCESIESGFKLFFGEVLTTSTMVMSCYAGGKLGLRMLFTNRID